MDNLHAHAHEPQTLAVCTAVMRQNNGFHGAEKENHCGKSADIPKPDRRTENCRKMIQRHANHADDFKCCQCHIGAPIQSLLSRSLYYVIWKISMGGTNSFIFLHVYNKNTESELLCDSVFLSVYRGVSIGTVII